MKFLKVAIEVLSPLHLGSAKADVVIDAEAIHDQYGMPYFPAKRLKGLLYESALEMAEFGAQLPEEEKWFTEDEVKKLFGAKYSFEAGFSMDNFTFNDYDVKCRDWCYLKTKYPNLFGREEVWQTYTKVRYSTALDENGIVVNSSLRNMRVVDKGCTFYGEILLKEDSEINIKIINYALLNLRYVGTKRNRGLGEVKCYVIEEE